MTTNQLTKTHMIKQDTDVSRNNRYCALLRAIVVATVVLLQCMVAPMGAYAQGTKVTFNKDNATVGEVLSAIKTQTSLSAVFDVADVDLNRRVSIKVTNKEVAVVLALLFADTNVKYVIDEKHYVLSKKGMVGNSDTEAGGEFPIVGTVKDASGAPMIGVTATIKGTTKGTTTDTYGAFTLNVKNGSQLLFSYIGYQEKEVLVSKSTTALNIVLNEDVTALDEVVVTALGIKRKTKALSYNVAEISSSDVTTVKDPNFINSLTGKVAGLVINNTSSGVGGGAKVQLRGARSITKSNNALYVIDGIPMFETSGSGSEGIMTNKPASSNIADINPEDIESMSVLSGAAAAALYGSNAGNGVILITTKRGVAGKAKISLSHSSDFMSPLIKPSFQNRYGNLPGEFSSWGAKLETPSTYNPMDFFQTGYNATTSVTLSTGTEKNQTFVSVASTNAKGIVPNNEYNRYNFTVRNTSNFLNERMTLDIGASYIIQDDQNMVSQGRYYNPLVPIYLFPRGENFDDVKLYERFDESRGIPMQYWPYGNLGMDVQNPYWITNRNMHNNNKDRLMANISLKYEIADWLNIAARARVDNTYADQEMKLHAGTNTLFSGPKGQFKSINSTYKQTYGDVMLNFDKTISDFSITATLGASILDAQDLQKGVYGALGKYDNKFVLNNIDVNARNSSFIHEGYREQTQSVFASAEVGYKGLAYLTLTGRNDWDSRLAGTNNLSFFYPSVGLSVVLSQMISLPEWFTFAKVRGSYSQVGIPPSRYLTMPTHPWNDDVLSTEAKYPVEELKSETTKSYEAGLDLKFFDSKLDLYLTYYRSNTYNQTFDADISASSKYTTMTVQTGNIQNEGIEISVGYDQTFGKDFNWASQFTFSTNRNKIVELVDNKYNPVTGEYMTINKLNKKGTDDFNMILTTGGQIGDIYTTQRLREDSRGNIYVSATNTLDVESGEFFIGNTNPKANMSLRNNFSWKGINMGVLFTARLGGNVVSATQAIMDRFGVSEASAVARDNGGVPINMGQVDSRHYYELIGGGQSGLAGYYTYSATNVRLQEVSIGYTLPRKWFNDKLGMTVSAIGKNLWMIYNKAPFDPELTASTGTFYQGFDYFMAPSMRNIGFSVNLTF